MSKVLEVHLTDKTIAILEQIAIESAMPATKVAEEILNEALAAKAVAVTTPAPIDFEAALTYALNKNKELLQRLAK